MWKLGWIYHYIGCAYWIIFTIPEIYLWLSLHRERKGLTKKGNESKRDEEQKGEERGETELI